MQTQQEDLDLDLDDEKVNLEQLQRELGLDLQFLEDSKLLDASKNVQHSKTNPRMLASNSTSHVWVFGAIAELIDNAQDSEAQAKNIYIYGDYVGTNKKNGFLNIKDDGTGLTRENLHRMLSFGFSQKELQLGNVGKYGIGFKSGSMRIGDDVLVITKEKVDNTISVALLSQTYLRDIKADDILTPILTWKLQRGKRKPPSANPDQTDPTPDLDTNQVNNIDGDFIQNVLQDSGSKGHQNSKAQNLRPKSTRGTAKSNGKSSPEEEEELYLERLKPTNPKDFEDQMKLILRYAPLNQKSEETFLQLARSLGESGTVIHIFNLRRPLELEFQEQDIILSAFSKQKDEDGNEPQIHQVRDDVVDGKKIDTDFSLRAYLEVLYLEPRVKIKLQNKLVEQIDPRKFINIQSQQYGPFYPQRLEQEKYDVSTEQNVKFKHSMICWIGYNDENEKKSAVHRMQGFNIYNNNRLIRRWEQIGRQKNSNNVMTGIVGVISEDFLIPTHNKQDIDKSKNIYQKFYSKVREYLNDYYNNKQTLKRAGFKSNANPDDLYTKPPKSRSSRGKVSQPKGKQKSQVENDVEEVDITQEDLNQGSNLPQQHPQQLDNQYVQQRRQQMPNKQMLEKATKFVKLRHERQHYLNQFSDLIQQIQQHEQRGRPKANKQKEDFQRIWKLPLTELTQRVLEQDECQYFKEPVDVEQWKIQDYYIVIKQPMDFGTIFENLQNDKYTLVSQYFQDSLLVFTNCYKYNREFTEISGIALRLQSQFTTFINDLDIIPQQLSLQSPVLSSFQETASEQEVEEEASTKVLAELVDFESKFYNKKVTRSMLNKPSRPENQEPPPIVTPKGGAGKGEGLHAREVFGGKPSLGSGKRSRANGLKQEDQEDDQSTEKPNVKGDVKSNFINITNLQVPVLQNGHQTRSNAQGSLQQVGGDAKRLKRTGRSGGEAQSNLGLVEVPQAEGNHMEMDHTDHFNSYVQKGSVKYNYSLGQKDIQTCSIIADKKQYFLNTDMFDIIGQLDGALQQQDFIHRNEISSMQEQLRQMEHQNQYLMDENIRLKQDNQSNYIYENGKKLDDQYLAQNIEEVSINSLVSYGE